MREAAVQRALNWIRGALGRNGGAVAANDASFDTMGEGSLAPGPKAVHCFAPFRASAFQASSSSWDTEHPRKR